MKLIGALVALCSFAVLVMLIQAPLGLLEKLGAIVLLLIISGMALARTLPAKGEWGLVMLETKKGLKGIDRIARWNPSFWRSFADFGLVTGFGLFAMRVQRIRPRLLVASFIVLIVASFVVSKFTLIQLGWVGIAIGAIGGIAGLGIATVAVHAATILAAPTTTVPGVMPVLPGITIPFFSGLAALAILASTHEICHGILCRVEKIPLKSAGALLFGVIPIGAFIEPNEKLLKKQPAQLQNRVFVAGPTINFALAALFLVAVAALVVLPPTLPALNERVVISDVPSNSSFRGLIQPNTTLLAVNGEPMHNVGDLSAYVTKLRAGDRVALTTDKGPATAVLRTDRQLGVVIRLEPQLGDLGWGSRIVVGLASGGLIDKAKLSYMDQADWPAALYLFGVSFGLLSFVLNLAIGMINMFPIFGLDGYRIVELKIGRKVRPLAWALIALLVINALPWFVG